MHRIRAIIRGLADLDVVTQPRYLAWERRHVLSAVKTGTTVVVVVLVVDAVLMFPVAPAMAALNLPLAVVGFLILLAINRRSGPRRNPRGAAFVVGLMTLLTSLLPLGLAPEAGPILLAYIPLDILAMALFVPWNRLWHTSWMLAACALVVGFIASPFAQGLSATAAGDLMTITVEAVLVSFAGHHVLQRQRRSMFMQRMQVRGLNQLAANQGRDLRKLADELRAVARIDPLTGVANRLGLDEDLARVVRRPAAPDQRAALMVDIDRFKDYNDSNGHLAGDVVLRRVAAALTAQTRPSDRVYRYGGEEFVVLLAGASDAEAAVVAERQRAAVASLGIPTGRPGADPDEIVTVSIGVASIGSDREAADRHDDWLRAADEAMYASKLAGRNRVTIARRMPVALASPGGLPRLVAATAESGG